MILTNKINEAGPNGNVSWMGTDGSGKKWEDYDTIKCPDGQVIDMAKLLDEQQRAKAALLHLMPYFGAFISKLRPIYTFRVQTQATDGYNLFINPQFTYNLDLTGKVFVMAHEILHCVLNHMRRAQVAGHNPQLSNIAADYEVNSTIVELDLIDANVIKKIGGLYDSKYAGWGYEKIYDASPSGPKDPMSNNKESGQAQKNQQNQQNGQNQQSSSGGSQGQNQQYSDEYKAGWNKAIEDYKKGKLKF